jgi:hypothetical protein
MSEKETPQKKPLLSNEKLRQIREQQQQKLIESSKVM